MKTASYGKEGHNNWVILRFKKKKSGGEEQPCCLRAGLVSVPSKVRGQAQARSALSPGCPPARCPLTHFHPRCACVTTRTEGHRHTEMRAQRGGGTLRASAPGFQHSLTHNPHPPRACPLLPTARCLSGKTSSWPLPPVCRWLCWWGAPRAARRPCRLRASLPGAALLGGCALLARCGLGAAIPSGAPPASSCQLRRPPIPARPAETKLFHGVFLYQGIFCRPCDSHQRLDLQQLRFPGPSHGSRSRCCSSFIWGSPQRS